MCGTSFVHWGVVLQHHAGICLCLHQALALMIGTGHFSTTAGECPQRVGRRYQGSRRIAVWCVALALSVENQGCARCLVDVYHADADSSNRDGLFSTTPSCDPQDFYAVLTQPVPVCYSERFGMCYGPLVSSSENDLHSWWLSHVYVSLQGVCITIYPGYPLGC